MKWAFCGAVAVGLFLGTAGPAKAEYVFTTIDVPGSTFTIAYGINASGEIVGQYRDAGGVTHGFLLSGGVYTTLDVPGGVAGRPAAPRGSTTPAKSWGGITARANRNYESTASC